jgi:8-oxo-dGTP pyrophosphatase MutT (NUDIX family)
MKPESAASSPALTQVGALPIRFEEGEPLVLLLTSRESKRWVIPKGWPMKGKKNWAAAAQEAKEEAGILGRTSKKPIGYFNYSKRRAAHFDPIRVEVYLMQYEKKLDVYREKGQRDMRWVSFDEAARLVEEPGLADLLLELDATMLVQSGAKPGGKREERKVKKKKKR